LEAKRPGNQLTKERNVCKSITPRQPSFFIGIAKSVAYNQLLYRNNVLKYYFNNRQTKSKQLQVKIPKNCRKMALEQ